MDDERDTGNGAPPVRSEGEVVSNRVEGGVNFRLALRVPDWPGFEPGQFAMFSPGALGGAERHDPLLPRPMAIYRSTPRDGASELEILYKVSGRGTALLADARPGERIRIVGPLGRGFPEPASGSSVVLVGGGTGIASLYALAGRARRNGSVVVLLGARRAQDLMGHADFSQLGVALTVATEDGSSGRRGLVTDLLEAELGKSGESQVYACGPTPMMRTAAELAARAGARCMVSLENPMACGFGVCLGCAVPLRGGAMRLVCRDGPVFDAARIDWERLS
jgi:dihydroorotate dehydrogenase electron transfer subunit